MPNEEIKAKVNVAKDNFVSYVMMIADSTPEQLGHMGHKTVEAALKSYVVHYRKQLHQIIGD